MILEAATYVDNEVYIEWGNQVVTIVITVVLITYPVGGIAIN